MHAIGFNTNMPVKSGPNSLNNDNSQISGSAVFFREFMHFLQEIAGEQTSGTEQDEEKDANLMAMCMMQIIQSIAPAAARETAISGTQSLTLETEASQVSEAFDSIAALSAPEEIHHPGADIEKEIPEGGIAGMSVEEIETRGQDTGPDAVLSKITEDLRPDDKATGTEETGAKTQTPEVDTAGQGEEHGTKAINAEPQGEDDARTVAFETVKDSQSARSETSDEQSEGKDMQTVSKRYEAAENNSVNYHNTPFAIQNGIADNPAVNEAYVNESVRHITGEIVESFERSEIGEVKEIKVRLKPEFLGDVEITLKESEGKVTALLKVSNDSVREALQIRTPEIELTLKNQGVNIDKIELDSFSSQFDASGSLTKGNQGHTDDDGNHFHGFYQSDKGKQEDAVQKTSFYYGGKINYLV